MAQKQVPNVLVTGASGYLGQRLVKALQHYVTPDNQPVNVFTLSRQAAQSMEGVRSFTGDILQPGLMRLLEEIQPDVIYHLAAAPPSAAFEVQLRDTLEVTRHLLQALVEAQPTARVVLPGTFAEYGKQQVPIDEAFAAQPETEWAMIKAAQSNLGRVFYKQYGLPVIMTRIFELYGETPTNPWVAGAANQVAQAEKRLETYPVLKPKSLQARRDLIHVDDVVSALLALGEKGRPGEVYNIATNQPVEMQEVVRVLLKNARLRHFEIKPTEDIGEELLHGRIGKMDVHTGWKPKVDLETGVLRELRHWREQAMFLTADV